MGRGREQREVVPGDTAPSEGRAPGSASHGLRLGLRLSARAAL